MLIFIQELDMLVFDEEEFREVSKDGNDKNQILEDEQESERPIRGK